MNLNDLDILRRHVSGRDPRAFGELVARHLDWVYSAALRQVRDPHMADDVTQAVFLALAQHASKLTGGVVLEAWLFRVTRRASAMALRAAGRRRTHERRAAIMMSEERPADMDARDWETLAPVLDEVVEKLGSADRQSILLRYYQQKSFAEIAQALAIGEPAARKRISRAIEKMRAMLAGRGMGFAAGTLAAGMLSYTSSAAPASTAASVAVVAATPSLASPTVLSLSRGALKMMPWTNAKIGAGAGLLVMAAIGLSIAVAQVTGSGKAAAPAAPPDAKATAAAKPDATAPASAPATTRPVAPAAQPLTPKGVVVAAYKAGLAGDERAMLNCFTGLTPQQEATLKQAVHVLAAVNELQKAVSAEFGENAGKQFAALGSGVDPNDVLNAPERVTGAAAVVDMGRSGPGEVPLQQVGNDWKISAQVLRTLNVPSLAQWDQKAPAIRKLAADITAGKYATLNDLQQAMGALMR
jgi:RNA polymerase sigma factor (sigma-70 family)